MTLESDAQSTIEVAVEPDTETDVTDGLYVTYGYLDMLVRRANSHCPGCTC